MRKLLNRLGNPFVKALLRSQWHGVMSKHLLLITITGRKSGKVYTIPVSYHRDGTVLRIISWRHRQWWRNLRDGASVTLRLQGRERPGRGEVIEDDEGVAIRLMRYLQTAPHAAKDFDVSLDTNGQPNLDDVRRSARTKVVVQIPLTDSTPHKE